jgi:hypothetical protein
MTTHLTCPECGAFNCGTACRHVPRPEPLYPPAMTPWAFEDVRAVVETVKAGRDAAIHRAEFAEARLNETLAEVASLEAKLKEAHEEWAETRDDRHRLRNEVVRLTLKEE